MLSKYFFTALKKITAHAQNFSSMLYVFDYKRNEDGLSELKILVSAVRFCLWPPLMIHRQFIQKASNYLINFTYRKHFYN